MGKVTGFLEVERVEATRRPIEERVKDWREFELPVPDTELRQQASRCMDCGIPFCHDGCPLGNLIPDFNDFMYKNRLAAASASLHSTNNFPEVTGRICPAPCEGSCVLNLEAHAVTIKNIEHAVADQAWESGLVRPLPPSRRTGKSVAVVGSGPAGLAAAQQLARKGYTVTVFERDDRIGGLLRYGIPDFKLEKFLIDRRVEQMRDEGVRFRTGVHVGFDVTGYQLRGEFDAIVLCGGARRARDLPVPGRELKGVHFAMDFLTQGNRRVAGDTIAPDQAILATGRKVTVIGGGDTGSDCVGTSGRQGAASITQIEIMPKPPEKRAPTNPWPAWPLVLRSSSSHEEGCVRDWAVMTTAFLGDEQGSLRAIRTVRVAMKQGRFEPIAGTEAELPCDLAFLAMGFVGSEREGLLEQLGVTMDPRGNVAVTQGRTNVQGVYAAGDQARGQSLVVWAIAEGRKVAEAVHADMVHSKRRLAVVR